MFPEVVDHRKGAGILWRFAVFAFGDEYRDSRGGSGLRTVRGVFDRDRLTGRNVQARKGDAVSLRIGLFLRCFARGDPSGERGRVVRPQRREQCGDVFRAGGGDDRFVEGAAVERFGFSEGTVDVEE